MTDAFSLASAPIRAGLMVPSNNTTMEGELLAWLPAGSAVTTVKIPRGPGLLTAETIPAYRDSAISLARRPFGAGEVDLIADGCTAARLFFGTVRRRHAFSDAVGGDGIAGRHDRTCDGQRAPARSRKACRGRHALPRLGQRPTDRALWLGRNRGRPARNVPRARCCRARAHHRGAGSRPCAHDDGIGLRRAVHRLLAASDPRAPPRPSNTIKRQ